MVRLIASNIVTAVLVSAFWIFAYNMTGKSGSGDDPAVVTKKVPGQNGEVAVADGVVLGPSGLAVPVSGIAPRQLVDTFTQARAGGARVHDAIDIMAPEGTAVVAAAPGTVEKLFFSKGGGGISAYVRSEDQRWSYYYAHLRSYAPGIAEGLKVPRGALLGYVGHTGNASPDGPHLHFAVNRMRPGEQWHEGTPVNPYPLLAGKSASR
jgi:murein DD-endopeptidase MepM/ murein hydrolase activator NlpD